jgi:hypothetical protein
MSRIIGTRCFLIIGGKKHIKIENFIHAFSQAQHLTSKQIDLEDQDLC